MTPLPHHVFIITYITNVSKIVNFLLLWDNITIYNNGRAYNNHHGLISSHYDSALLGVIYYCMFQAINLAQSNSFIPVADGDINTKSYAYIRWLILVSPDTHRVLQQLRRQLRSSIYILIR